MTLRVRKIIAELEADAEYLESVDILSLDDDEVDYLTKWMVDHGYTVDPVVEHIFH